MAILMAVENLASKTDQNHQNYLLTFLFNHPTIIHTAIQKSSCIRSYYFALNLGTYSCVFPQTNVSQKHRSLLQEVLI